MAVAGYDTFYIPLIDAGYHRGSADVHSLDVCEHKGPSTPDTGLSLVHSICSSGYWIVRVPFFFHF